MTSFSQRLSTTDHMVLAGNALAVENSDAHRFVENADNRTTVEGARRLAAVAW